MKLQGASKQDSPRDPVFRTTSVETRTISPLKILLGKLQTCRTEEEEEEEEEEEKGQTGVEHNTP